MNKNASGFLLIFIAAVLLAATDAALAQDPLFIKEGIIVPVVGPPIPNGSLLIVNGKIAKLGTGLSAPAGATVIEAKGMYVYPGMVAPLTAIGLTGYPGAGNDTNEVGQSTPQIDAYEGLNPEDETIEVTRIDGVTSVLTAAGTSAMINGRAVALNLDGDLPQDMLLKRDVCLIINVGARSESGPNTVMGVASFIRDRLTKARDFAAKKEPAGTKPAAVGSASPQPAKRDPELETLSRVLSREIPVLFMTSDEVTIRSAIELIDEFSLKGNVFARADVLKYADQLAAKKIPVVWGGTTTMPQRWEAVDINFKTAAELAKKGVLFAFNESPGQGSRNVRRQPVPASLSMAYGLSEEDATKAITINPARILGIDDKVGSLEEGKIANVVICSKPIVQMSSKIRTVIINGRVIPLTSVQTRLRDKYGAIVKERMKKE